MTKIKNFIKAYWLYIFIVIALIIFIPKILKKPRPRRHRRSVYSRARRIKRAGKNKGRSRGKFYRKIHGRTYTSAKAWGAAMKRLKKK